MNESREQDHGKIVMGLLTAGCKVQRMSNHLVHSNAVSCQGKGVWHGWWLLTFNPMTYATLWKKVHHFVTNPNSAVANALNATTMTLKRRIVAYHRFEPTQWHKIERLSDISVTLGHRWRVFIVCAQRGKSVRWVELQEFDSDTIVQVDRLLYFGYFISLMCLRLPYPCKVWSAFGKMTYSTGIDYMGL